MENNYPLIETAANSYDSFAWFYDRYWATAFHTWQMPALEQLLFRSVSPSDRILDLCCGTGNLVKDLMARGYHAVGVDSSREMLTVARAKAPDALFLQADATTFTLPQTVNAAVCTFDSLNHLLTTQALELALSCVHRALKPGGVFVFDVNSSDAYGQHWDESVCEVHPDHAFFLRGGFDSEVRMGVTHITMFRLFEQWTRSDVEMRQRPWEIPEVENMLKAVGFPDVSSYRAVEDLRMAGHYGTGRVYFRAFR